MDPLLRGCLSDAGAMRPTELIIRNDPTATRELRSRLDAVADQYGLGPEERFDLKLAATEALTNALKGTSAEHAVRVKIVPSEETIEVEVADRRRFRASPGVENEGGRGIPLMLALVDEVEFATGARGTRVRMRKRITPAGEGENPAL